MEQQYNIQINMQRALELIRANSCPLTPLR